MKHLLATPALILLIVAAPAPAEDKASEEFKTAPTGAIVLFDGKDLSSWIGRKGNAAAWKVTDGYVECIPGKGDIVTKEKFGPDFQLHVEFWVPLVPNAKGQARGNSGVFLQGRYEIQILDSYMNDTYANGSCGALYGIIAPNKNVSRPPEQWQSYDITFHSPRLDGQGRVTQKGQVTVVHNGVTVIDKGEFAKMTEDLPGEKMGEPGPIRLQDHGNKVRFRNIWLKPLKQ